jgi:hypothetical protein
MTIVSAVLMIGVSLATPAPSIATLRRYGFGVRADSAASPSM